MPIIAPNYLANISFRGHLNWDDIAKYSVDMGMRIYSKRNVTNLSKIHEGANGIVEGRGLPEQWTSRIKDITKFDKDSFIVSFGEMFKKERDFADLDRLQSDLSNLFQNTELLMPKLHYL